MASTLCESEKSDVCMFVVDFLVFGKMIVLPTRSLLCSAAVKRVSCRNQSHPQECQEFVVMLFCWYHGKKTRAKWARIGVCGLHVCARHAPV